MLQNLQEQTTLKKICERLLLDLESENPLNFEYLVQIFFLHHVINAFYLPQVKVTPPFITSQMFIKVINQT